MASGETAWLRAILLLPAKIREDPSYPCHPCAIASRSSTQSKIQNRTCVSEETTHRDQPIRLALVGLGGHGGTIQRAAAAAEGVEVVAVCDPVASERAAAAERFGCDAVSS